MRSTSVVLAALAAALLVVGCSEEAERAQVTTTTTSTTAAPPPTTATVAEPEPDFTGDDSEAICALAGDEVFLSTFDGVQTGDEFRDAFDGALGTLDDMAEVVPAELAPDLSRATSGLRTVRERLAAVDFELLRIEPTMLESPGMDQAFRRVDRYLAEVCRDETYEPPAPRELRSDLGARPADEATQP